MAFMQSLLQISFVYAICESTVCHSFAQEYILSAQLSRKSCSGCSARSTA